jgi:hypothetical protein
MKCAIPFSPIDHDFGILAEKEVPNPSSKRFSPVFFARSFVSLGFTSTFNLIFV